MRQSQRLWFGWICWLVTAPLLAAEAGPKLANEFPQPEGQGGWRTLLPETGDPDDAARARIREAAGVDWDKLRAAWDHNAQAPGGTGLLVIRKGQIVGEWYRDGGRTTTYNIYSSSKSYLSTAFGMILADFNEAAPGGGKALHLADKVCNAEWLPESLPLSDPRRADITVKQLLQMASGLGQEQVPKERPFEWVLGHVEGSPFAKLKNDPGTKFHYSNGGDAHLVLLFQRAAGSDLSPFLKERLLDPIGETFDHWQTIGGGPGEIGPYSQGFSGIHASPREHARFCYLAMHRGEWAGKRVVPESYYDFAWSHSEANPSYGAQWWTDARFAGAPAGTAVTLGRNCNDGFIVPSLDLVVVRLGNGETFPEHFERDLLQKVVAAVTP